jgi:hypothetical protein
VQRVALQTLGTRLAVVSIVSFLCKGVSVAISYFGRHLIADSAQLGSIMFLATTLAVQAVPSAVTLLLLNRFLFSQRSEGSGVTMQSLLTHASVSVSVSSDSAAAAARQSGQAPDLAAENAMLRAEIMQLNAEQASRLHEETEKLRAQVSKLQLSSQKSQEENAQQKAEMANMQQAYQRLQHEILQLQQSK